MRAIEAARKAPVTVARDDTLATMAAVMDRQVVGAVVVVEDDRPVGIVTDRDLVVRGLARQLPPDTRADAVMSPDLVTIDASADLREAIQLLRQHPFRRLPLTDEGRMVGMLSVDDLLINGVDDLNALVRSITGQVIFGHPEAGVPAEE
jgi:CBS domain-containing protein